MTTRQMAPRRPERPATGRRQGDPYRPKAPPGLGAGTGPDGKKPSDAVSHSHRG